MEAYYLLNPDGGFPAQQYVEAMMSQTLAATPSLFSMTRSQHVNGFIMKVHVSVVPILLVPP